MGNIKMKKTVSLSQSVPTTPVETSTSSKKDSSKNSRPGGKQWKRFLDLADEYKRKATVQDRGAQVWLDSELKKKLELLRASGLNYPVRQLLNAAVSAFLETNEADYKAQIQDNMSI